MSTTIHLAYADKPAAITALTALGLTAKDIDGNPVLPSTLFAPDGSRLADFIIAGGGSGIEYRPTGATQPGPLPGMTVPVYAPLPGYRLSVLWSGPTPPDFGEDVTMDGEGEFLTPGAVVQPVPEKVSQSQFMRAAAKIGLVTAREAEDYLARGDLPDFVASAIVKSLAPEHQSDARLKAIGATEFYRTDDLFTLLIASGAATSEQVDALFQLAGTLN